MKLAIQNIQEAYHLDDIEFFRRAIARANLREKHKRKLLYSEGIADYPRPLWVAPKSEVKFSLKRSIKKWVSIMLV